MESGITEKITAILVAVIIFAVVLIPIVDEVSTTTRDTNIQNDGAEWLKLGYSIGNDFDFDIVVDTDVTAGTQTGAFGDMIYYADADRTIISDGNAIYMIDNSSVHTFEDGVSVISADGTLTIEDGTTVVYSGAAPDWAYIPDENGNYGFFKNGGLTLEEDKPKVAVGSFAQIFAYNNDIAYPVGVDLNFTMIGDYAEDEEVSWGIAPVIVPTGSDMSNSPMNVPNTTTVSGSVHKTPLYSANPSNGTRIGDLYYTFSGTNATVIGYASTIDWTTFTSIPDTVVNDGTTYTVKEFGDYAFNGCTSLALTSLPSGVTYIGNNAFQNCTNLALTSLPSGITGIGVSAFSNCPNVTFTQLPEGITTIKMAAFFNCTNLALTSLPSGVTSIGENAFSGCTNLALTSLPSGVTSIGNTAFGNCTNLALTSLPNNMRAIGSSVFFNCTNLALTSLPSTLTSIGGNAFYGCTNLALTSLPDGVTTIGQSAFQKCTNLALTSLPSGVTNIGIAAFQNCTNLALTSLPSGVTSIGANTFYECTSLALTSLPSGLTTIGNNAFYHCISLALTSLPNGLTSIGDSAFQSCTDLALTSLPNGLVSIGYQTFYECTNLTSLIIQSTPTIDSSAFYNCTNLKQILNLGDLNIVAGSTANGGIGRYAEEVRSDIPAMGYVAPTLIVEHEVVPNDGIEYQLLLLVPVLVAVAVLLAVAYSIGLTDPYKRK